MAYYVYILQSAHSGHYYVGMSANPTRRLQYHNSIETGWTARYRPWQLVFTRCTTDRTAARHLEKRIKGWKSRKMIERLIAGELQLLEN